MEYIKEFAGAKLHFLVTASPEWKEQFLNYNGFIRKAVSFRFYDQNNETTSALLDAVQLKIKLVLLCGLE